MRAQEELKRAGRVHEFAQRLAALESDISAGRQRLQLRQKALDEIEEALRSLNLAKASRITVEMLQLGAFGDIFTIVIPEEFQVLMPVCPLITHFCFSCRLETTEL